jgi:negative regulator of sigma-B (phosphoserine phosphatase)
MGETVSGDAAVVVFGDEVAWAALVDGLGHGPLARQAAERARTAIESFVPELSVVDGLLLVHEALRGTRGAAAALARFDARGVDVGGVGNVSVRGLGGVDIPFAPVGGVLGGRCRPPRGRHVALLQGARILLMTDGVSRRAPLAELDAHAGQSLCDALVERHGHAHDDATALLVTYVGQRRAN